MIQRRPSYYDEFHCLGSACPDTCCRDWSVVPDEDALADYACAPSPLRERIAQSLVTDEDGDVCFRLDENGMCALLTTDGLCRIQRDWGEAHLCGHCKAYPRFIEEYGCLTESSLAVSCPEAARLLLEAPRFTLVEEFDGQPDAPFADISPDLLAMLERTRAACLAYLDHDPSPLWEKLRVMLGRARALQERIDAGNFNGLAPCAPGLPPGPILHRPAAVLLLNCLAELDPLRPDWPQLLKDRSTRLASLSQGEYAALRAGYQRVNPNWERQFTNTACCFVFRHWHKTVNDGVLYGRAAFICATQSALYHLCLFQPGEEASLWSRFSREVEHDEDNLDQLVWALSGWDPSELL